MNIRLTPEQEGIINDELKAGHFRSAEEVIAKALSTLREQGHASKTKNGDYHQAVQQMLDFIEKNRVSLDGLSVKELIHEGRRF